MKKIISTFILIFFWLSSITLSYATSSLYTWSTAIDTEEVSSQITSDTSNKTNTINENNLETNSTTDSNTLNLESGAAILIEQTTGQVLYAHNAHEQLRPASVTKIMSILLIMEQIDEGNLSYTDTISCSENARSMGGSQIWLDTRETLTVDEMLKAICIVSANDCVTAMAEYLGGTEENFVNMMNEKAKLLGMNDTNYKNCHGIDEDDHYTSSYDIALLSKALLNTYPEITKYTTIYMDTLRNRKI